jgi:hypothetical protein
MNAEILNALLTTIVAVCILGFLVGFPIQLYMEHKAAKRRATNLEELRTFRKKMEKNNAHAEALEMNAAM